MIKPPTITAKRQRKQSIESFIAAISDAKFTEREISRVLEPRAEKSLKPK